MSAESIPFPGDDRGAAFATGRAVELAAKPSTSSRLLAAAVYVHPAMRDGILAQTLDVPDRAWGPCYGVDLGAVLGHAHRARVVWRWVDRALLAVLIAGLGFLVADLDVSHGVLPLIALVALGVDAPLGARFVRRLRVAAADMPPHRRKRAFLGQLREHLLALAVFALVAVAGVVTLALSLSGRDLLAVAVAAAVSFLLLFAVHYWSAAQVAHLRRETTTASDISVPVPAAARRRLAYHGEENVVVYAKGRARTPFLGSGGELRVWHFPVKLDKGRMEDGERLTPKPFDTPTLHEYLERTIAAGHVDGLEVAHRLYVDGRVVKTHPDLFPGLPAAPVSALDPADVRSRVADRAERVRAYLSAQITDWRGGLVVTLFTRATIQGTNLIVEGRVHSVPTIAKAVDDPVSDVPELAADRFVSAVGRALLAIPRALLGSPRRCVADVAATTSTAVARYQRRYLLGRRRPVDFGAIGSIREVTAAEGHLHFNASMDEDRHLIWLEDRALSVLKDFLEEHDVDTSSFDDELQIFAETRATYIGSIHGTTVQVGDRNTASSGGGSRSGGGSGAGAGAGGSGGKT